ncbi:MAG: 4Fe-4S dicluster domain-containing protein, partial [Planctomycetaceae bacterium]
QSDFLGSDRAGVRNSGTFATTRDPDKEMSRLYVVEGGYSNTGVAADTRLAMRPSEMAAMISEVERRIDRLIAGEAAVAVEDDQTPFDELDAQARVDRFLSVVCQELKDAGEAGVVLVGESLGVDAIAAGIRLNNKLGSLNKIQRFSPLIDDDLGDTVSLADLAKAANAGRFESMVILGDNPGFTAPGDVKLLDAISRIENSVYIGEYDDETAEKCRWSLPLAHPLEAWGDCLSDEGLYGVCQPQILPLLGGRSVVELLATMLGEDEIQGRDIVRRTADAIAGRSLSEREWRKLLHDGFDDSIVSEIPDATYQGPAGPLTEAAAIASSEVDRDAIDVLFLPADGVYDGRFANNGWLQELPQSLTKLTWDNAAVMSPRTAKALAVQDGSMVVLRRGDEVSLELPVFVMPGVAPGVVAVSIGYGRTRAGMVGGMASEDVAVVGFDVSALRSSDSPMWARQIEGRPRYNGYTLACTQDHWAIDDLGRNETERRSFQLVREGTTALLEKNEHFASDKGPHVPHVGETGSPWTEPIDEIQTEKNPALPQWGMSIDLNKCFGCNACVVACQSENNVPIVGKEQVINSREMHWLRVDRYFQGNEDHANVVTQPMLCQHCETAPCEQVCPVAATVHTDEGLNAMAYNRCIGTRYCANNCPFKVRRFNYFNYNTEVGVGYGIDAYPSNIETANRKLQQLVLNPDVTVRGRGVMEKCTFCVQRIEHGKIEARKDGGRPIRDGEIKTACQMACPSGAIEFGNIHDETAVVTKKQHDRRAYGMLSQLNVKPRTIYLAKIRNTHPRLMTAIQLADLQEYGTPKHHGGGHGSDAPHGNGHGDDSHSGEGDHPHATEKTVTS